MSSIENYQCQICGGCKIEMVERCLLGSVLSEIDEEGHCEIVYSGDVWDGQVERFQCEECGEAILDEVGEPVQSIRELAEVARERGWLTDCE